jgi:hypothetical protein
MPIQRLMIVRVVAGLSMGLALIAGPAAKAASPNHITVWVPDFFDGRVYVNRIDNTVASRGFSQMFIDVSGSRCNPNSVVIRNTDLYVVCSGGFCNGVFCGTNQILVYNTGTHAFKKISGVGTDGQQYFSPVAGLIGSVFDRRGNLWVSLSPLDRKNTNELLNVLLRIPSRHLGMPHPLIDRVVIDSPDQPAGLALDADGSLWVVGQFDTGIVVNFEDAVINKRGIFLGANPLDPGTPRYCISNDAPDCQQTTGMFNNPEGVAVFQDRVWVSNNSVFVNGRNEPAETLVRLIKDPLTHKLTASLVRGTVACPGGLFAAGLPGTRPNTLWVNDEGYDVPNTDCGSSAADQRGQIGRVLEFLPKDLLKHPPTPEHFTGWMRVRTSSPGFGGIFVQMD